MEWVLYNIIIYGIHGWEFYTPGFSIKIKFNLDWFYHNGMKTPWLDII